MCTILLNGCVKGIPIHIVYKDDRSEKNHQSNNGIALDMIMPHFIATKLGIQNVHANLVMISLVKKNDKYTIGKYSGRLGAIQRKFFGRNGQDEGVKFSNYITDMVLKGQAVSELIEQTSIYFIQLLRNIMINDYSPVYNRLDDYQSCIATFYERDTIRKIEEHPILSKYMEEIGDQNIFAHILICIPDCVALKKQRHGLMYGSHVVYKQSQYITPCGVKCDRACEYFAYPCTVRAFAVQIWDVEVPFKETPTYREMSGKYMCKICARVYCDLKSKSICEIYCSTVPDKLTAITTKSIDGTETLSEKILPYGYIDILENANEKLD